MTQRLRGWEIWEQNRATETKGRNRSGISCGEKGWMLLVMLCLWLRVTAMFMVFDTKRGELEFIDLAAQLLTVQCDSQEPGAKLDSN